MAIFDPPKSYMMPTFFGPRYSGEKSTGWYRDVTAMTVAYETDRAKLQKLLPEGFTASDPAIITVTYACNKDIDWLAGRGYNLIGVHASVSFTGNHDQLTGQLALVMWEDLCDPIITGRELQGIPKLYATIPEHKILTGQWLAHAEHFDNPIVKISISDLTSVPLDQVEASRAQTQENQNPMGYRYIPGMLGYGEGFGHPTHFPSENHLTEVQLGTPRVAWSTLTWEQNPTQFHIVNALAELPIEDYVAGIVTRGSTNLILPDRLPRALS